MVNQNDPRLRGISQPNQSPTDPRLRTAEQRIAESRARQLRDQQITAEAKRLDEQFKNIESGNINEVIQVYSNIPQEIKNKMSVNIQQIKDIQQNRINSIKNEINQLQESIKETREDISKSDSKKRRDREKAKLDGLQAEVRELERFIPRLQQGEILDVGKIKSFASKVGSAERKQEQAKREARRQRDKAVSEALKKGAEVSAINYEKGTATIGGQTVKVPSSQLKTLKLSSQVRAKQTKELNQLATKAADPTKQLTVSDFEKARELGIKSSELLDIQSRATTFDNLLKQAQTAGPEQVEKFRYKTLSNKGLTNEQIQIVQQTFKTKGYTEKFKDLNTDKFFKQLEKRNIASDSVANVQAYKIAVNQAAKQLPEVKPLPFQADVKEFEKLGNKINKTIEEANRKAKGILTNQERKELSNLIKPTEQQAILNKAITGQTMTPDEMKKYATLQVAAGQKLQQEQWKTFVKLVESPKYLGALGVRYQNNPNLIKQDLKKGFNFTKGVGNELKNIGKQLFDDAVSLVALAAKGEQKVIESGINYFTPLVVMSIEGQGTKAKQQLKTDVSNIVSSSVKSFTKGGKKVFDVGKWVAKNPTKTAGLVTAAALLGIGTSFVVLDKGRVKLTDLAKQNPERAVAELVFLFFPQGKALKAAEKIEKGVARALPTNIGQNVLDKFTRFKPAEYISDFKVNQNLKTGTTRFDIDTKGVFTNGEKFTSKTVLRLDNVENKLFGNTVIKTKDQTITKNLSFEDKGAFYLDKKNNIKIPKQKIAVKNAVSNIKETKITPSKSEQARGFEGVVLYGTKDKTKGRVVKTDKGQTIVKSESQTKFETAYKNDKTILSTREYEKKTGNIKSIFKKSRDNRTPKEDDFAVKLIESLDFDQELLKGVDRRTRTAEALNISPKEANKLLKDVDKLKEEGYIILREGKARATGTFEKLKPNKTNLGVTFLLKILDSIPNFNRRGLALRKSKKAMAQLSPIQREVLKKVKKTKGGVYEVPTTLKIPQLDSIIYIPRTTKYINRIKIPSKYFRIGKLFGFARDYKFDKISETQKISELKKIPDIIKNIEQIKTPSQIKTPKKVQVKTPKKIQKVKTAPGKKIKTPTMKKITKTKGGKSTKPPRPKKLPDIDIDWSKRTKPEQVLIFEGVYRERKNKSQLADPKKNPIVQKKIRIETTKNRALKRVADLALNSLVRSVDVKIIGKTGKKIKEINEPDVLKNFRAKRSKNNKVLRLVQKEETLLKNPQEKAEFERLKRLRAQQKPKNTNTKKNKKKSSKKTTKKTKSAKKSKKSSKKKTNK